MVGQCGAPRVNPLRLSIRMLPIMLAVLLLKTKVKYFSKNWSPDERHMSSTWKELKAVQLAIGRFTNVGRVALYILTDLTD